MDQGMIERERAGGAQPGASRLDVQVSGMSCAACVRRVKRAAAAVPGVQDVAVNLATERAAITHRAGFRLPDLTQALQAAGYPIAEATVDLAVSGMSCASCSGRVEQALLRVPGVLSADVNLASERVVGQFAVGWAVGKSRAPCLIGPRHCEKRSDAAIQGCTHGSWPTWPWIAAPKPARNDAR